MVYWIVSLLFDWSELLLWFWFYETRLKLALITFLLLYICLAPPALELAICRLQPLPLESCIELQAAKQGEFRLFHLPQLRNCFYSASLCKVIGLKFTVPRFDLFRACVFRCICSSSTLRHNWLFECLRMTEVISEEKENQSRAKENHLTVRVDYLMSSFVHVCLSVHFNSGPWVSSLYKILLGKLKNEGELHSLSML